ncbi:MFS transporter [Jannaschia seohaensis]|uniref:Cyanate permease n=1 Tax=Jannaschia seohaensis TaxID=475081 RepID=A0A2Y9B3Z8_9RHOB|nr:MFS transporter [Jannaschia seohaensis]PWJ12133.1 cyanate permease [Jannaschia seohaensis]SSA51236.1 Cyanate permease [Jannaschia seohaensis]
MERTSWNLVGLVFLGGLLAAAQFGKIALTLPEVADAFGRPVTGVAFLVSMVGVMGLVLGPMAGGISASLGAGRVFLGGLVLGGAMSLLQAAMPGFGAFAVSRAVEGLAHLGLVVGGPPLMAAAASDRDRPLVMGLWAVFFGASLVISAQLFPSVLAAGGLPMLFAGHGALLLLLAVALWRRVPRGPVSPLRLNPVTVHREIYGSIRAMAPGLGFFCYTFLFVAGVALLPDALGRPGLATVLPLVTLASTLAGGALCRRIAPHHVALLGYGGTALGAALALAGLPGGVELSFAAMGLVPGASFAAIPAWNATEGGRVRATGAIAQLGNLGTVTGTPVLAWVWVGAGAGPLLVLFVAAACLGGALAIWAGGRAHRMRPPPGDLVAGG